MIAVWFSTMVFVLIGFQHVVTNMFIIPAAIFAGALSWVEFIANVIPVFLGNAAGGAKDRIIPFRKQPDKETILKKELP